MNAANAKRLSDLDAYMQTLRKQHDDLDATADRDLPGNNRRNGESFLVVATIIMLLGVIVGFLAAAASYEPFQDSTAPFMVMGMVMAATWPLAFFLFIIGNLVRANWIAKSNNLRAIHSAAILREIAQCERATTRILLVELAQERQPLG